MADYYTPTVVQQTIPNSDMTPLERLLLTHMFSSEPDGDGLYFFSEESPCEMLFIKRAELDEALAASATAADSRANSYIREQLSELEEENEDVELDLTGTSWEFFFQDITRRSATLTQVSIVASFYCSKMRPDGFGGMATLITKDLIKGKSTGDLLAEFEDEAENGPLVAAPGFGIHVLLTLSEQDVRAQLPHIIETTDALTQIAADAITDADIRAACLLTASTADIAEAKGSAIFKAAVRAIHEAERRHATPT